MLWIKELNPCAARRHACMESFALPGAHPAFCSGLRTGSEAGAAPVAPELYALEPRAKTPKNAFPRTP